MQAGPRRILLVSTNDALAAQLKALATDAPNLLFHEPDGDAQRETAPSGAHDAVMLAIGADDTSLAPSVRQHCAQAGALPVIVVLPEPAEALAIAAITAGAAEVLDASRLDGAAVLAAVDRSQARAAGQQELRRYVAELEQAKRGLEQFARVAAHDLRAPLAMIHMELSWLMSATDTLPDKAVQSIREVLKTGAQMRQLVEDLLSYARTGEDLGAVEQIDCNGLIQELLQEMQADLSAADAQFTTDMLPTLWGNRKRLTQLFQHLLANALRFRGADAPRIHLSAEFPESMWVFTLQDNGSGIGTEDHERVFEPFTRRHANAGNGMGLAICRRVVEAHGGTIWLESEPGQGTTVYFSLPNRPAQNAAPPAP
ncbi:MAG TPA: ATP-binding protein [Phycisphaerae bacterium]|nr:hypothetical protein [Phycisphaerales bacterium]HRX84044.1 ATP-binding protein [Phycisphaerae bacterium]